MAEYIIDTGYNDGYTAPEVHDEAVVLAGKLNPQPLTRCRDCHMYGISADGYSFCKRTLLRTAPDGYCSWCARTSSHAGRDVEDAPRRRMGR